MIGLISGTSEGKNILSLLNNYTDDIFVSTATPYGGELLKDYKYKVLNTKPLTLEELVENLKTNKIILLIDASHPYAQVITENAIEACKKLNIDYVRYERPSVIDKFENKITKVKSYEDLYNKLLNIDGTILNTTGSVNIEKIITMNLKNRIVHRVLPSIEVIKKCFSLGVKTEDIIAIKGPISYDLNLSFIKEYNAKAIILKDSGVKGGTIEKIEAALDSGIKIFVIMRSGKQNISSFSSEEELVNYIVRKAICY